MTTTAGAAKTAALPNLDTDLVHTDFFTRGYVVARAAMSDNGIVAFDGPAGTGKTTCARYVAHHSDRPCTYARIPYRPAPLDLLRYVLLGLTGTEPVGTRFAMQNQLRHTLERWRGVLIVDELQHTQKNALEELVYQYEETGRAFGLVIVGSGVTAAVAEHPQLSTRITSTVTFAPLIGDNLLVAVRHLDRRFHRASAGTLAAHDDAACRGLLRRWSQTVHWLNRLGIADTVTAADLSTVRDYLTATPSDLDAPPRQVKRPGRRRTR